MSTEGGRQCTVMLSVLCYRRSTALLLEKLHLQKFYIFRWQLLAGFSLILWLRIQRKPASSVVLAVLLPAL